MAGLETLTSHEEEQPRPSAGFKRLSERTPLRTKLITAVLALVILALAAISVASVVMLRRYVETRQDSSLQAAFSPYFNIPTQADGSANLPETRGPSGFQPIQAGYAYSSNSDVIWALQQSGSQVSWYSTFTPPGGNSGSDSDQAPLPQLPTSSNWASAPGGAQLTVPARSGPDSWRVIAETQTYPAYDASTGQAQEESLTLVAAVDLGDLNAMTTRLVLFDLVVGGAIVIVLAAAAIGVVRTNLRPLNDIELTAGQIAAGHLDHRVPEGDPRTEIGSLGRSLNAMLSQIERAFHAQQESERAAHQSEERMRRFIADASHELRTPLTTIRGFAAHYRQRGGAGRLRPGALVPLDGAGGVNRVNRVNRVAGEDQSPVVRTDSASSGPANGAASGGVPPEGLSPADLDHLMGRVEAEATRMGLLVEDLLTLARLDQQRPLNRAPVDLLTLAADAVQDARIVSPGRPIDLIVAPGTAFLVDGDEPRLRQVLANLVNNAITHTPAGTPVRVKIARGTLQAGRTAGAEPAGSSGLSGGTGGTVGAGAAVGAGRQVGTAGEAGVAGSAEVLGAAGRSPWGDGVGTAGARERAVPAVVLDVEDDGPGMTVEQAQRVFERFYRADAARNRASGGTGLGLAIVAGLVAAHGGTVSVRTAPGKGADFQVLLPLSPDALAVDDPDSDDDLPA